MDCCPYSNYNSVFQYTLNLLYYVPNILDRYYNGITPFFLFDRTDIVVRHKYKHVVKFEDMNREKPKSQQKISFYYYGLDVQENCLLLRLHGFTFY